MTSDHLPVSIFEPKLQELGRIRTGNQISTTSGKMRPARLETFRLTSENKPRLHAAANLYGGEVVPWEEAPQGRQWQLITETNSLPVTVPPFATISQCWERWSGGGCQIRCDGERIIHAENPEWLNGVCQCPDDPAERNTLANKGEACQPVTRLNVLLHEVPGIGVWRLDTRGFYAGSELMAIVPFLQKASAENQYLACDLQLETRQVKRAGQTRVFPVVTLQPANVTLLQLLTRQIPDEGLIATPQLPKHTAMIESPSIDQEDNDDVFESRQLRMFIKPRLLDAQMKERQIAYFIGECGGTGVEMGPIDEMLAATSIETLRNMQKRIQAKASKETTPLLATPETEA
jgi:Recombination directionality factor-like